MAEKKVFFTSDEKYFEEKNITYEYFSGFAVSQKQKSINSLHNAIKNMYGEEKILEISTKSQSELGVKLSAFNLKFYHEEIKEERWIENVFQSSKVFESGGPYRDLLNVEPKNAKRDERLKNSGNLIAFNLYGENWTLDPKSMFYDWLYIKSLVRKDDLAEEVMKYNVFTDIEFNHLKSINCQARSAAIFVSLKRKKELDLVLEDINEFKKIYGALEPKQMTLF